MNFPSHSGKMKARQPLRSFPALWWLTGRTIASEETWRKTIPLLHSYILEQRPCLSGFAVFTDVRKENHVLPNHSMSRDTSRKMTDFPVQTYHMALNGYGSFKHNTTTKHSPSYSYSTTVETSTTAF